jgi:hypothetical protein
MNATIQQNITEYEILCDAYQAQTARAKGLLKAIQNQCDYMGVEYCSHNLALLGSKRYAKYREDRDTLITKNEWAKRPIE